MFTCKGTKEEIKPLLNSKEIEFIKLYDCAFNGLNSTKGNKQVDYYLDYNGRTKKELVEEAFKAYNFYNDRNAPNYIKDIYPHIYYKSKDEGCVCYFIYDEKTDSIRLKASLKNLVNNQPTWYDLKVA